MSNIKNTPKNMKDDFLDSLINYENLSKEKWLYEVRTIATVKYCPELISSEIHQNRSALRSSYLLVYCIRSNHLIFIVEWGNISELIEILLCLTHTLLSNDIVRLIKFNKTVFISRIVWWKYTSIIFFYFYFTKQTANILFLFFFSISANALITRFVHRTQASKNTI